MKNSRPTDPLFHLQLVSWYYRSKKAVPATSRSKEETRAYWRPSQKTEAAVVSRTLGIRSRRHRRLAWPRVKGNRNSSCFSWTYRMRAKNAPLKRYKQREQLVLIRPQGSRWASPYLMWLRRQVRKARWHLKRDSQPILLRNQVCSRANWNSSSSSSRI